MLERKKRVVDSLGSLVKKW